MTGPGSVRRGAGAGRRAGFCGIDLLMSSGWLRPVPQDRWPGKEGGPRAASPPCRRRPSTAGQAPGDRPRRARSRGAAAQATPSLREAAHPGGGRHRRWQWLGALEYRADASAGSAAGTPAAPPAEERPGSAAAAGTGAGEAPHGAPLSFFRLKATGSGCGL